MKILHISSAKTFRGGEHQVCLLIKELALLGAENILLCPSGSELSKRKVEGLSKLVTYMKLSPANMFVSAFIKKLGEQEKVSLIHLHDPHSHQFTYYSYKLFANKVPSVVTRRVSFPIKNTSRFYYAHPLVKKVISLSNSVEESLSNLNLSKEKLAKIPSGIELNTVPEKKSLRDKLNISSDFKIIANLAAISPQKDFITFVKAANEFIKKYQGKVKFLIIGRDEGSLPSVEALINELGVKDNIIITGYIQDAHQYLTDVDILLSTSVSEGLGNTIQEAMKYQIPIVATSCEGTVDLVEDQSSALLADIGDFERLAQLINQLIDDGDLRDKLTKNAFNRIQQYDIRTTSLQVHNLYNKVLRQG